MSLTSELKELVEGYLEARKGRSRLTLAQSSGVSYNSITRILQNETVPSFEVVLGLLKVVAAPDEIIGFVRKHYSDVAAVLLEQVSTDRGLATQQPLEDAIKDSLSFTIVSMAEKPSGTTPDTIEAVTGKLGLLRVEELIGDGLLTRNEKDGRIHCDSIMLLSYDAIAGAVRNALATLDRNHRDLKRFHISWRNTGLNEEGYKEYQRVLREMELKLGEIEKDPKYKGDITAYSVSLLGRHESNSIMIDEQPTLKATKLKALDSQESKS